MGRFSLAEIDDGDIHNDEQQCWEFVANPGEEGAMVISERTTKQNNGDSSSSGQNQQLNFSRVLSHEGSDIVDYTEPDFQQKPRSFTARLWNVSIAVIFVGWLFQRYLPPAPPPSLIAIFDADPTNDAVPTWTSFLSHHSSHLIHSLVALTVHVPLHVSQWFLLTLSTDFNLAYERYKEYSSSCRIRDQPVETTSVLQNFTAGQNTAIRIVADTVETWQLRAKRSPLLLLFTGFPNTGKTTMARALMEHVLLDDGKPCSDPLKRILVVQGQDFSESVAQSDVLMNQIVRHVNLYSSGSMVLIQQIEDMEPDLFEWLVRTLFVLSSDASFVDDNIHQSQWSQWSDCCPSTVFVFSSNTVGRNSIARALRQGNMHHTDAVFLADLIHDVDSHFNRQKFKSRSWLDAVVPFQPLTRETLGEVLSLKVSQLKNAHDGVPWNKILITDRAKDAILGPTRVEYLEWKRRDRPEDDPVLLMNVAINGAQILDEKSSPLWKQILASMNRCFFPFLQSKTVRMETAETAKFDYSEGGIVLQTCYGDPEASQVCNDVCSFSIL